MGEVSFRSAQVPLAATAGTVFTFLADLNNLQAMMPEQVVNWQSEKESCSFDIKGMAHITLHIAETIENKFVRIKSGPETPLPIEIRGAIEGKSDNGSEAVLEISAELSPMLKLMVSGPLQNLVNIMAEKLKDHFLPRG